MKRRFVLWKQFHKAGLVELFSFFCFFSFSLFFILYFIYYNCWTLVFSGIFFNCRQFLLLETRQHIIFSLFISSREIISEGKSIICAPIKFTKILMWSEFTAKLNICIKTKEHTTYNSPYLYKNIIYHLHTHIYNTKTLGI